MKHAKFLTTTLSAVILLGSGWVTTADAKSVGIGSIDVSDAIYWTPPPPVAPAVPRPKPPRP